VPVRAKPQCPFNRYTFTPTVIAPMTLPPSITGTEIWARGVWALSS